MTTEDDSTPQGNAAYARLIAELRDGRLNPGDRLRETGDRRDFLAHRIDEVRPWDDLVFPPEEELAAKKESSLADIQAHWSVEDGAITGETTPDNPTRGYLDTPGTRARVWANNTRAIKNIATSSLFRMWSQQTLPI